MADKILNAFDVWITAQGVKSRTRLRSVDNISLEGIARLRELILDLAIMGRLVKQDASEEPAIKTIERINVLKANLLKEKKIINEKKSPKLTKVPFQIPSSWHWCYLDDLGIISSSSRVHQKDWQASGIPFYRAREIVKLSQYGYVDNELFISQELYNKLKERSIVPEENDIMITGVGTIGIPYLVKKDDLFYFKDASVLIFKNVFKLYPDYLRLFFTSKFWDTEIHNDSMGTTVDTLTIVRAKVVPIPLPPIEEQHRIVAKVDELMALCDALEQQEINHLKSHQLLVQTLLGTLTQAKDASDFQQAWNKLYEHFDDLFTTEDSIDQLKQTILQLAVTGKLVPQAPNDEPASVLLKKIAKEKERLVEGGKIKKQKAYEEELEMSSTTIPETWSLVKCQDISLKITDGEHATPNRSDSGYYLLSARNVTNEGIILDDVDFVPAEEFNRIRKRCDPNIGDILISCSGSVGRVASVDKDNAYAMVRSAAMIRPSSTLAKEYIVLVLKSPQLQSQIKSKSKQSAQANLFLGAISELILPIAPFNEQKRIVAKVDELFVLCDRLKEGIAEAQKGANQMADGVVAA